MLAETPNVSAFMNISDKSDATSRTASDAIAAAIVAVTMADGTVRQPPLAWQPQQTWQPEQKWVASWRFCPN